MKHYGAEPPWRGASWRYGHWEWVEPDPELWMPEQGYWLWIPPPRSPATGVGEVLERAYLPRIKASLDAEGAFVRLLEEMK